MNWGFPKTRCGQNRGAVANVGDNKIFFLHVARRPPVGTTADNAIFSITDICVGGVSLDGKGDVEQVVADVPGSAIPLANRGSDSFCTLANVPVSAGSGSSGASFDPSKSEGSRQVTVGSLAVFLIAGIALSF